MYSYIYRPRGSMQYIDHIIRILLSYSCYIRFTFHNRNEKLCNMTHMSKMARDRLTNVTMQMYIDNLDE